MDVLALSSSGSAAASLSGNLQLFRCRIRLRRNRKILLAKHNNFSVSASKREESKLNEWEIPPNAVRRKVDRNWRGGFSLGVDLGLSNTGIALSKGYRVRPLTVLRSRGQKLETRLLEIAQEEEVDEFIIGLPRSSDGKETVQSNKVRSVAGRLAVQAAERGLRVYVLDEHGTSSEASDRMIVMGLSKSERQKREDAYAAVILLERYFSTQGLGTEIILPKSLDLQEKLKSGALVDPDFFPGKLEEYYTF